MTNKFSRLLLSFLLIILMFSSVCYATEGNVALAANNETTNSIANSAEETSSEPEIYNGDLYLCGNNVVMDKLVDGNVFIVGNKVNITGKINGNLFVLGNKVEFNESLVVYSIYVCANSVYYNAGCNEGDLYVASKSFESTYASFIARDLKLISSNAILKSAIGRDADLIVNHISFGEEGDLPVIYNNLRYSALKEAVIPEGVMDTGVAEYKSNIANIFFSFAAAIITVIIIYIILKKFNPTFLEKLNSDKFSFVKLLKLFGIGLVTLAIIITLIILLIVTTIGIKLALILTLLFVVLCLISVPLLSIKIADLLKPAFKTEQTTMYYLILILVSIILYGLGIIPLVGGILGLIIKIISIGSFVNIFIPHKELTEEKETTEE